MEMRTMLIPLGGINRTGRKITPTSVTIHNTANPGATALNHANFLPNRREVAGWHWVVDDKMAILNIPEDEHASHTGSATGNTTSIGIEICEVANGIHPQAYKNAVKLTADICRRRKWPANGTTIRTHRSWINRGVCPRHLQGNNWDKFIADVAAELAKTERPQQHKVQRGDTYGSIATRYGVAVADLRRWNGWADTQIPVGSMMWLVEPPQAKPAPPPHKTPLELAQEEIERLQKELAAKDKTIAERDKTISTLQDIIGRIRILVK